MRNSETSHQARFLRWYKRTHGRRTLKMPSIFAGAALMASVLLSSFVAAPANAGQIFIQQTGSAPAGGDPNLITDTSAFVLGLAGAGQGPTQSPLLVGVADYN